MRVLLRQRNIITILVIAKPCIVFRVFFSLILKRHCLKVEYLAPISINIHIIMILPISITGDEVSWTIKLNKEGGSENQEVHRHKRINQVV